MLHRLLIILLFTFQGLLSVGQEIPIGEWRDHLPYSDAISVSYGNGLVYCATNSAVFIYDKSDMTIERLNLISGLSDIGLSKVKYNSFNNRVIIAYANGNIDIVDENKNITNLSFIKNSNIVGSKTINHIYLQGKLAYLSTGFGIVVLDTDKLEIVDTYLFGPLGNFTITNAVTMDSINIYAATDQGVFYANKNSINLNDYNVWTLLPDLGTLKYSNMVTYSNRLFVSLDSPFNDADTLYYNDSGVWQKFIPNGITVESINVANNTLIIVLTAKVNTYNSSLTQTEGLYTVNEAFSISPKEAVIDNEGIIWYAEESHGLIKSKNNWNNEVITPNGPSGPNAFNMDFITDELWIVSGGYGISLAENIINHSSNFGWKELPSTMQNVQGNNITDLVSVAINPTNSENVYAGSWSSGLLEFNNGILTQVFDATNSILDSLENITVTGPLAFDTDNNLWITNSFTTNILAVKTPSNDWSRFSFPGLTSPSTEYHNMIIDQNNYKWITRNANNSIIIFDDNHTIGNTSDDRFILNNNIPGGRLNSIVEDLDGEIWLGTDEGIAVFYNPSAVFDENIKAEQIFIQQDGQTQILLETVVITVIKIDGANRKWIGTQSSGVFLMSEDGAEQIEHFTTENSPLFSNNILDIVLNPKTGEVFFGTAKGLISYKGTATDADDDFNNVFVYPNPVKPDFNGTIAIRGLVKDTDVRITDISGNIVYQTISLGGQAIWDGKDFNGNKVQTGVYMVFNGSPDGELKAAAKILFIH